MFLNLSQKISWKQLIVVLYYRSLFEAIYFKHIDYTSTTTTYCWGCSCSRLLRTRRHYLLSTMSKKINSIITYQNFVKLISLKKSYWDWWLIFSILGCDFFSRKINFMKLRNKCNKIFREIDVVLLSRFSLNFLAHSEMRCDGVTPPPSFNELVPHINIVNCHK